MKPYYPPIDADQALKQLETNFDSFSWLDVRSEKEFEAGEVPGFSNVPILTTRERHEVGICFKAKGQQEAIDLGQKIVAPFRQSRVENWLKLAQGRPIRVACWRGGLRSKIAVQWLNESGADVCRIAGGYKAIRRLLLNRLSELPTIIVIGGLTGSGKTELLHQTSASIDLEALANHRGSSFGKQPSNQPSQCTFENKLLMQLAGKQKQVFIEDESPRIGRVQLPNEIISGLRRSVVVWLDAPVNERIERIFTEYVAKPTQVSGSVDTHLQLRANLLHIREQLGGLRYCEIRDLMDQAFAAELNVDSHRGWIERLLKEYYDPRYQYSFERHQRKVVFQGDLNSCQQWIRNQHD